MTAKPVAAKTAAAAAGAEEAAPLKGESATDLHAVGNGALAKASSLGNGDRAQLSARSHSASGAQ